MKGVRNTLQNRVLAIAARYATNTAVEVGDRTISYAELIEMGCRIGATINREAPTRPSRVALYGGKSITTYAALVGVLLRGSAYVPLSLTFSADYNRQLIERSDVTTIVVEKEGQFSLPGLLERLQRRLVILFPDSPVPNDLKALFPQHGFVGEGELAVADELRPPEVVETDIAYILFTSGSTGTPKGVPVTHSSIIPLIESLLERHAITPNDRIAQVNDLTFDLSVAEMFTSWFSGATLCPLPRGLLLNLSTFLRDTSITVLHTAPSIGLAAYKMGSLTADSLPQLRISVFAGEALPIRFANAWSEAAPNSIVDNLYGPTEAAVYVTGYKWWRDAPPDHLQNGTVPIGYPLPGVKIRVVDEELNEVPPGEKGELLLGGPQVASGYLADPDKTGRAFIRLADANEIYYRTGDIVTRADPASPLLFYGRRDHQIKILGIRIELGQIEAALREASGVMDVAAVGWPPRETSFGGIAAFIGNTDCDIPGIRKRLSEILNPVVVPKSIYPMKELPLTTSGKVDRNKLRAFLQSQALH